MLTLREVVARALADVGAERHVALGAGLSDEATVPASGRGELADVALVRAVIITPKGEVILKAPPPFARELWAVIVPEPGTPALVESLPRAATARVTRLYHPVAVAEVGERGLVIRKVVRGKSAREVAAIFGVPCAAGPDLAEWAP